MENIHATGYKLLSVKYLFDLQVKEGQAADFIQYIPKTEIFDKDGYFTEVNEYLVTYNNDYIKRLLESHLHHAKCIIDIWNNILSIIPENATFESLWENRYDICCSFRQNIDFPFGELYLTRNRFSDIFLGNTSLDDNRYWNPVDESVLSNFNLNTIKVFRVQQVAEEVHKIHAHLSYMLYGNTEESETKEKVNTRLFDFGMISKIHRACNAKQFEDITDEKLYNALNYPSQFKGTLKIKSGEKTRMYCLIGKLSESIHNEEWAKEMCDILDFSVDTYLRKKSYVEEDKFDEINPNSKFLKEIEAIFSGYTFFHQSHQK